jgi:hypothetical protein
MHKAFQQNASFNEGCTVLRWIGVEFMERIRPPLSWVLGSSPRMTGEVDAF